MPKTPEYTKKAINNYREKFDFIQVRFPKGTKEKLKEVGDKNSFIVNCVLNALDGSQNADTATKTAEPEKIPETPKKTEKTPVDLAELQKLFDEKKAEIDRKKRIEKGEFMTVAKEEEERYRGREGEK